MERGRYRHIGSDCVPAREGFLLPCPLPRSHSETLASQNLSSLHFPSPFPVHTSASNLFHEQACQNIRMMKMKDSHVSALVKRREYLPYDTKLTYSIQLQGEGAALTSIRLDSYYPDGRREDVFTVQWTSSSGNRYWARMDDERVDHKLRRALNAHRRDPGSIQVVWDVKADCYNEVGRCQLLFVPANEVRFRLRCNISAKQTYTVCCSLPAADYSAPPALRHRGHSSVHLHDKRC